jgi:hypothetical protein
MNPQELHPSGSQDATAQAYRTDAPGPASSPAAVACRNLRFMMIMSISNAMIIYRACPLVSFFRACDHLQNNIHFSLQELSQSSKNIRETLRTEQCNDHLCSTLSRNQVTRSRHAFAACSSCLYSCHDACVAPS